MRNIVSLAAICFASSAFADHLDVSVFELREGCSLQQYLDAVDEFNEWGTAYGYQTEIAVPLQSSDLTTLYWMGRSANAEAFGKAWDAWRNGLPDSSSEPARIQARLNECGTIATVRRGYDVY